MHPKRPSVSAPVTRLSGTAVVEFRQTAAGPSESAWGTPAAGAQVFPAAGSAAVRAVGAAARGLTLLELLAAIAVAAVATGIAVTGARSLRRSVLVEHGATLLASALRDARMAAYQTEQTTSVVAKQATGAIVLFDGSARSEISLPASVRIAQATRGGLV
ncbi:MAG: prepilin-type N-terminal cleavage/methylation domain-containing protein, partial [Deltaproteobacteria bacterium]